MAGRIDLKPYVTPALALAAAGLFTVAVFVGRGGLQLGPMTLVEVLALATSAAALTATTIRYRGGELYGAYMVAAFAALTVLIGLSIGWSLYPSESLLEFNRAAAYLGILGLGIAAVRLWGNRWTVPLCALLIYVAVVVIAALATKVAPGSFAAGETFARLRAPYDYWNAVALTGAFGVPLCLWLGTRRDLKAPLSAIAYPFLGLCIVTIMLAFSRGGLAAAVVATIVWFAVVPLRLRSLTVLLPATVVATAVTVWAFSQPRLTDDNVALSDRSDVGLVLGVLLLAMVAILYAAGYWITVRSTRTELAPATRLRIGTAAVAALAIAPLIALGALAFTEQGIGGRVSSTWRSLTSEEATTPANTPARFTSVASVRARYWREAIRIWKARYYKGAGAGSYAIVRNRYRKSPVVVRHAHGQLVQAMADLGIMGALLTVLAGLAWLAAGSRTLGIVPRDRELKWSPERVGLAALAALVIAFGFHAAIDWTWYVPGVALPALFAAGWVAGRGPLPGSASVATGVIEPPGSAADAPDSQGDTAAGSSGSQGRLGFVGGPALGLLALAILLGAAAAAWSAWQPLRADRLEERALELAAENDIPGAVEKAREARDLNPLSVDPLFALSAVYTRGENTDAGLMVLEDAVKLQPANPETWHQLGLYELYELDRPARAIDPLSKAVFLDPLDRVIEQDFIRARQARLDAINEQRRIRRKRRLRAERRKKRRAAKKRIQESSQQGSFTPGASAAGDSQAGSSGSVAPQTEAAGDGPQ